MKNCLLIIDLHDRIWNKITNTIDLTSWNQGLDKQKPGLIQPCKIYYQQ